MRTIAAQTRGHRAMSKVPQYQSFPDAPGDSQSLQKLQALRLPRLLGKRFLDIACNEGFFCGYARFAGAAQVVGLDISELFINRARHRFPDLHFLQQSWDHLPGGPFDVILLASSLHYADDPVALLQRAMQALDSDGTLVVELGIAPGDANTWVDVQRGADTRRFPTEAKLREILQPYGWKLVSNSPAQSGDPVPRYALHINHRKPVAFLLMQGSGYGKTMLCRDLFTPAGIHVVSGDQCLYELSQGQLQTNSALQQWVAAHWSGPQAVDQTTRALLQAQRLPELVNAWLEKAQRRSFVLDAWMPTEVHDQIERTIRDQGYLVVRLNWERPVEELHNLAAANDLANDYFSALTASSGSLRAPRSMPFTGTLGAIVQVQVQVGATAMEICGWAVHENGQMPKLLGVKVGNDLHTITEFERLAVVDVQNYFGLPHALYGFRLMAPVTPGAVPRDIVAQLQMYGGNEASKMHGPFLSHRVQSALAAGSDSRAAS